MPHRHFIAKLQRQEDGQNAAPIPDKSSLTLYGLPLNKLDDAEWPPIWASLPPEFAAMMKHSADVIATLAFAFNGIVTATKTKTTL